MGPFIKLALRLHTAGWSRLAWIVASVLIALRPLHVGALRLSARLATENGDLTRAEALCLRLIERQPHNWVALGIVGDITIRGAHPERALPYFAAHDKLVNGPDTITRAFEQRHLDERLARQSLLYHRRLENVLVDTAYWSIMTESGIVYSPDTHGRNLVKSPFVRGRVWNGGKSVIASFDPPTVTIELECIFVGGDDNYNHWVYRNLMKLASLERDGLLHTLPWLLNKDLRPHQVEYLDLLGVSPESRILVDRGQVVRCDKLLVPAVPTTRHALRQGIDWIRSRLQAHLTPVGEAKARLYLSRADAGHRHILNEEALFRALEAYGFRMITPGRMSVVDQIRAFSGASIIVGAHGAALTNIVFAPEHASVIELTSSKFASMDFFREAARGLGQNITTLISDRYETDSANDVQASYFVDVQAVIERVERLCNGPARVEA